MHLTSGHHVSRLCGHHNHGYHCARCINPWLNTSIEINIEVSSALPTLAAIDIIYIPANSIHSKSTPPTPHPQSLPLPNTRCWAPPGVSEGDHLLRKLCDCIFIYSIREEFYFSFFSFFLFFFPSNEKGVT